MLPTLPTDIHQLFVYLGTPALIGFVLSWLAANWGWFNSTKVTPQGRAVILTLVAYGLGVVAKFGLQYTPEGVYSTLQPYWDVFIQTVTIILASQVYYHKVIVPARVEQARLADIQATAASRISKAVSFPMLDDTSKG